MNQTSIIAHQRVHFRISSHLFSNIELYYACLASVVLVKIAFHVYQFHMFYLSLLGSIPKQAALFLKDGLKCIIKKHTAELSPPVEPASSSVSNSSYKQHLGHSQRSPKKQRKGRKHRRKYFSRYSDSGKNNNYSSNSDLSLQPNTLKIQG